MEEYLKDQQPQEEEEEQPIIDMFLKILRPLRPRRLPEDRRHPLPRPRRPHRPSFRPRRPPFRPRRRQLQRGWILTLETADQRHRKTQPPKEAKSQIPPLETNGPETKTFYKLPQNPEVPTKTHSFWGIVSSRCINDAGSCAIGAGRIVFIIELVQPCGSYALCPGACYGRRYGRSLT